jgi:hypothetical protein
MITITVCDILPVLFFERRLLACSGSFLSMIMCLPKCRFQRWAPGNIHKEVFLDRRYFKTFLLVQIQLFDGPRWPCQSGWFRSPALWLGW